MRQPDHDAREIAIRISDETNSTKFLLRVREAREQHVDAHVLAVAQRVGHAEQADRRHQVPFELLRPHRAGMEDVAQQHVAAHHERQRERRPCRDAADEIDERIDSVGQSFRCGHVSP